MSSPNSAYNATERLLQSCEQQSDFWPNSRYFLTAGEWELAFEGLYLYLLGRDDLWRVHHATIRRLKNVSEAKGDFIDFLMLEEEALDGRHSREVARLAKWREDAVNADNE